MFLHANGMPMACQWHANGMPMACQWHANGMPSLVVPPFRADFFFQHILDFSYRKSTFFKENLKNSAFFYCFRVFLSPRDVTN